LGLVRSLALAALVFAAGHDAAPATVRRIGSPARRTALRGHPARRRSGNHETVLDPARRPLYQAAGEAGAGAESVPPTFVDLTPAQLAKEVHELKRLVPAGNQVLLPVISARVGKAVDDFFTGFVNTTCSERISSNVETIPERPPLLFNGKFNYVALVKPGQRNAPLEEFRTDTKGGPAKFRGLILTSGFVSLIAQFRPAFQKESRLRYLGRDRLNGRNTYVVAFAQRPGVARQAELVKFLNETAFVFLQGVAWIDPVDYRILRLRTEIQRPESNVGLARQSTEVNYAPVTFKQEHKTLWLPREVTVSGTLRGIRFSNQHRYSEYRLFVVQSGEKSKKT
jgi:hypothetical protein